MKTRTAAALVIGNEILTGKVQESNVAGLAQVLFRLGVQLRRVIVCPDDVDVIADDLTTLRHQFDTVITSGGVGPTHDDVTLLAVAQSFGCDLERSPELEAKIRELVGDRVNDGHLRMALAPRGAELVSSPSVPWPTIVMENVFVMPGVPRIFEMKLPLLLERLHKGPPFLTRALYTLCRETDLSEMLYRLDREHAQVDIGSYPVFGNDHYRVKLTFDGTDADAIDRALDAARAEIPSDQVVDIDPPT